MMIQGACGYDEFPYGYPSCSENEMYHAGYGGYQGEYVTSPHVQQLTHLAPPYPEPTPPHLANMSASAVHNISPSTSLPPPEQSK